MQKRPDGDPIDGYKDLLRMGLFCLFKREGNTFEAAAANSEVQGETEIRNRDDVSADMKIKYKNVIYDIVSVIPTQDHTLLIMWKRGEMNG